MRFFSLPASQPELTPVVNSACDQQLRARGKGRLPFPRALSCWSVRNVDQFARQSNKVSSTICLEKKVDDTVHKEQRLKKRTVDPFPSHHATPLLCPRQPSQACSGELGRENFFPNQFFRAAMDIASCLSLFPYSSPQPQSLRAAGVASSSSHSTSTPAASGESE